MSSRFFADQDSLVEVEFPDDGVTVWMRQYYDAGITEDVQNNTLSMKLSDGDDPANREARIKLGNLFTLQQMIVKIETNDKTYTKPIGLGILRKMRPAARAKLIAVVNENNPLEELEGETETEE